MRVAEPCPRVLLFHRSAVPQRCWNSLRAWVASLLTLAFAHVSRVEMLIQRCVIVARSSVLCIHPPSRRQKRVVGYVCPEVLEAAAAVSIRMPRAPTCAAALPSCLSDTRSSIAEMNPCSTREYRFHALHTRLVYPAGPLLHKTDRVQRRTSRERTKQTRSG